MMIDRTKIPDWWHPHDGDPVLSLLIPYLGEEDQRKIISQVLRNDIAIKEQALNVEKMALEMLKK